MKRTDGIQRDEESTSPTSPAALRSVSRSRVTQSVKAKLQVGSRRVSVLQLCGAAADDDRSLTFCSQVCVLCRAEAAAAGGRSGDPLLLHLNPVPWPRLRRAGIGRQLSHLLRVAAVEAPLLTEETPLVVSLCLAVNAQQTREES